ncbi:MAG: dehydrogenase, partial [Burkholderiaceae bacterium]|nr:dehydrogenase [Burkholderiaceae bacterium]
MKNVIGVSLGARSQDFEFTTRFLGRRMTVRRIGADRSTERAAKLLRHWETRADAIGLGVANNGRAALGGADDEAGARLARLVTRVPVTTGARLGDIFVEWAVRRAQVSLGNYFNNTKVLFFSGAADYKLAMSMSEYT